MSQEDFADARRASELFASRRFAESEQEFLRLVDHPRLAPQGARQLAYLALLNDRLADAARPDGPRALAAGARRGPVCGAICPI